MSPFSPSLGVVKYNPREPGKDTIPTHYVPRLEKQQKPPLLERQKVEKLLKRTDILFLHFTLWRPVAFSREKHFPASLSG